ncbi:hypothetical protein BJ875DRAFT_479458 [Amylocarpus encephaloides]|uniref:Zn(2)-C6 fungal-type domain-containing protein n=1 Tax=Amylocarpus encephaloides TaxID=45428 RepID=A0A9P7YTA2_9HELO|nr:hypothetical protein BJ875DRAFT_479458 [Amylocarpus encephaloides]
MDSNPTNWSYDEFLFQSTDFGDDYYGSTANATPLDGSTAPSTPVSSESTLSTALIGVRFQQDNKRRRSPIDSESNALTRPRKTRKLKCPQNTAKVRERGACYPCFKNKKQCRDLADPTGACEHCLSQPSTFIPGLLRPLCWRPNIRSTEIFRRGPTIDFAASHRGNHKDAVSGKQASWKHFATSRSKKEPSISVELSQNWTSNTMKIQLDRYQPRSTDKQFYSWYEDDVEHIYNTPAYGISNSDMSSSAMEEFLGQNFDEYISEHLRNASEITRQTFKIAREYKTLPLVGRALKLWVGCRFIEEPWSIVGVETLGMARDENPNSPYYDRIPVPPIVDLQIDLIAINDILQPEMKKILNQVKKMLESKHSWNNWFEIYLSHFILLHNVELTMAHDAWFVKRNNLKTKYSNKNLVDTIMQGATTLLTCFHYAHQGYTPFTNPRLEETQSWTTRQADYLGDMRRLLGTVHGDYTQDPARELFWTGQLHKPDWRPVVLVS